MATRETADTRVGYKRAKLVEFYFSILKVALFDIAN